MYIVQVMQYMMRNKIKIVEVKESVQRKWNDDAQPFYPQTVWVSQVLASRSSVTILALTTCLICRLPAVEIGTGQRKQVDSPVSIPGHLKITLLE